MTIRNMDHFTDSIQDWAILDGCFGESRIRPSDIDGFVECAGSALFLEAKRFNAFLSRGQGIAFLALAAQGNQVIVYWRDRNGNIDRMRVIKRGDPGAMRPATVEDLRREVREWYEGRLGTNMLERKSGWKGKAE